MNITRLTVVMLGLLLAASLLGPFAAAPQAEHGVISRNPGSQIAFNFVDVEIPTVIRFISEITGYNFLFDERVKGKITIIAPAKLSIDDSFNLFTSILSLKGYTIINSGPKTYKIIPSGLARQEGMITFDEPVPVNEAYITKLIPVEYINADEVLQFLRPIVSRDGHIASFGPGNMLLAVDSAVNIEKINSILRLIDKPSVAEEETKINVYFLEHADASDLSAVLQGIIKEILTSYKIAKRGAQNGGAEAAPMLSITPDKATNSLIVVAPPSDYENILQVIRTLDRKRKQVFVEAMIVEARIDKLRDLGTRWRATGTHNNEPVIIGGVGKVDTSTVLDIITGLSGLSVGGLGNYLEIPVTSISSSGSATTQTLTAPGFAALFSLNDFKDAVNVLSTPQILTSDNKEAEILVGENVPFISQRERDVVTTNTVLNSIQRTDVGIKLRITPQISEGDYVKLDIFQEISAVKSASDEILTTVGPTTTKRSTKTSVLVKDGRTVVIGGLMQERDEESVVKIPVLGDIPLLEWLFKFKSTSRNKTNLMVFLSPHIVKESLQLAEATENEQRDVLPQKELFRSDELLVKFRETVPVERALEIITRMKAELIMHFRSIDVYHVRLKDGEDVEHAAEKFSAFAEVLYAEPNYRVNLPPPEEYREVPSPSAPPAMMQESPSPEESPSPVPPAGDIPLPGDRGESEKTLPGNGSYAPPEISEGPAPDVSSSNTDIQRVSNAGAGETRGTAVGISPVETPLPGPDEGPPPARAAAPEEEAPTPVVRQSSPESQQNLKYYIQVGAWVHEEYAMEALNQLRSQYPEVYLVKGRKFHKVRIPGTSDKVQDALILRELREKYGMKPDLVR
ncbi:MAG: SPOR domain-containing protein [Nitrospiraceae bacterium]|nr:MAG: SPOR domain-containing protein [Nitrospiraceae bacterium]